MKPPARFDAKAARGPLDRLERRIRRMGRIAIAFSGGVDSSFLLTTAAHTLGTANVLALTARAPYIPAWEIAEARAFAHALGVRHIVLSLPMPPSIKGNPPDRCYRCKKIVFRALIKRARTEGFNVIADGTNADDARDYRPGMRALAELGVRSPLCESGVTKAAVRALSRHLGLATWDKPAYACLLSRIPYRTPIRPRDLRMIEQAERLLMGLGFRQVRVRHHGPLARVEVEPARVGRLLDPMLAATVVRSLKSVGYAYVALDLEGYRTGSLNEPLLNHRLTVL